jgi:hypothetical protein
MRISFQDNGPSAEIQISIFRATKSVTAELTRSVLTYLLFSIIIYSLIFLWDYIKFILFL